MPTEIQEDLFLVGVHLAIRDGDIGENCHPLGRSLLIGRSGRLELPLAGQRDHRLHAIYATSYRHTGVTFPLVWDLKIDYVHAVNVTDRYAPPAQPESQPDAEK